MTVDASYTIRRQGPVPNRDLHDRELAVVKEFAKGSSAKLAARNLGMTVHQVYGFCESTRRKLGKVRTMAAAVAEAAKRGLI